MDLLLGWLRLPIVLCVAVLRLLSFSAGIATLGALLMQRSESRFICFVVMPGGAGTLDELFETVTLIQTGKVKNFPILLYGKDYWAPMLEQIGRMIQAGTLGRQELEFLFVADSVTEATELLQDKLVAMWKASKESKVGPQWWFLEKRDRSHGPSVK